MLRCQKYNHSHNPDRVIIRVFEAGVGQKAWFYNDCSFPEVRFKHASKAIRIRHLFWIPASRNIVRLRRCKTVCRSIWLRWWPKIKLFWVLKRTLTTECCFKRWLGQKVTLRQCHRWAGITHDHNDRGDSRIFQENLEKGPRHWNDSWEDQTRTQHEGGSDLVCRRRQFEPCRTMVKEEGFRSDGLAL